MTSVLALHGFSGSPSSFDSTYAPSATLVTPWLAGHGPNALVATSFDAEAERLAALVETLAPPVIVLGYSLGGRLALRLLGIRPGAIASCIAIGASLGLTTDDARRERLGADARWSSLLRDEGIEAFASAWEAQALFATQRGIDADVLAARRAVRRAHDAESLASAMDAFSLGGMPDLRAGIAQFPGRIRFVAGELDEKFTALAREGADLAERGTVDIVAGAGHDVGLERPGLVRAMLGDAIGELG